MQHSADRHELKITGLLDVKSRSQQNRSKRLTNKKKKGGGRNWTWHMCCVLCEKLFNGLGNHEKTEKLQQVSDDRKLTEKSVG